MNFLLRKKRTASSAGVRKRFIFLSLIMIVVCTVVLAIVSVILYNYELDKQKEMLQVTAQSQARLLESIANKEFETAESYSENALYYDPVQEAINQIADAHRRYEGFGKTGEFTLARQEDDQIVFVLRHRYDDLEIPSPVDFNSNLAEPMRLALQGLSGTITGLDYRGQTVLAAYEPVAVLNLGIVAKIDLAEIRAPFIKAIFLAASVALLVILAGAWLFFKIGNPIIDKLEIYSKQLEKEIAQREKLNTKLHASNRELERVVYVSSHDLRSPLVNIDGYSKELELSIEKLKSILILPETNEKDNHPATHLLNDDIPEALHFIRTSAVKMDSLLTGLLKISRLGRSALDILPINMNELVHKVVEARDFQIKSAGIQVDISDLPPCLGDRVNVDQIFSNLLDNAILYLNPERPGKISIFGKIEGNTSVYCVKDNGIGIAPSHIKNIFEIFHRLNPSETKGEGLGLAIVQQAINRLSGEITVESELGSGSSFLVSLPVVKEFRKRGNRRNE